MELREFLKTLKESGVDATSARAAAEKKYGKDAIDACFKEFYAEVERVATTVIENRNDAKEIIELCTLAGCKERADDFIFEGKKIEEVRAAILASRKVEAPVQAATIVKDQTDKTRALIEGSILLRSGLDEKKLGLSEKEILDLKSNGARAFTFVGMAREALEDVGVSTRRMSDSQIISSALNKRQLPPGHTTTDFPYALAAGIEKVAIKGYQAAEVTWDKWCSKGNLTNYQKTALIDMSGMSAIGEIKTGLPAPTITLSDSKEEATLIDLGGLFVIDNKALVNDNMDMIKAAVRMSQGMATAVNKLAYAQLKSTMFDTKALFHTDHANLGSTAAISNTTITELVKLLRKMKDAKGNPMNLSGFNFLVSAEKEGVALQYLSPIISALQDPLATASVYRGRFNIIADTEIDDQIATTSYFLAANPAQYDTVTVFTLDGQNEPTITEQESMNGDPLGMSWQIKFPVVAKAASYKTIVKNVGA